MNPNTHFQSQLNLDEQLLLKEAIELCLATIESEKRVEPFKKTVVDCEANFALDRAKQSVARAFEAVLNCENKAVTANKVAA